MTTIWSENCQNPSYPRDFSAVRDFDAVRQLVFLVASISDPWVICLVHASCWIQQLAAPGVLQVIGFSRLGAYFTMGLYEFFWIDFVLFFVDFSSLESLIFVLPSRRNAKIHKIDVFVLSAEIDPKHIEVWVQKLSKNPQTSIKKRVWKHVVF